MDITLKLDSDTTKICGRCNGSGISPVSKSWLREETKWPCVHCDGRGYFIDDREVVKQLKKE
jgi:DnaJ-class molecular chaperone